MEIELNKNLRDLFLEDFFSVKATLTQKFFPFSLPKKSIINC